MKFEHSNSNRTNFYHDLNDTAVVQITAIKLVGLSFCNVLTIGSLVKHKHDIDFTHT